MKLNKREILNIKNKYDDCIIEDLFENHKIMGNWCILTCTLKEKIIDGDKVYVGGIFDFLDELEKFTNIKNLEDETFIDDDNNYYEYVSFEWK